MGLQRTEAKRKKSNGRGAATKYLYRYQVTLPGSKRATIRLGSITTKCADEYKLHIDQLVQAKRYGSAIDGATAAWIRTADKAIIAKLAKLGLCQSLSEPLVVEFVANYINGRLSDWAANTIINFRQLEKLIKIRFEGQRVSEVSRQDARDFYSWMRGERKLGENTAKRFFGRTREMFLEAQENGLVTENVFKTRKIKVAVGAANKTYIDEATINEVIEHCPTTEWKLLFAFARYVGCRIPSEIQQLRRDHVNWEKGTILITSPKTKRYGKGERIVPIFPEVHNLLLTQFEQAVDGEQYVFPTLRSHTNLGATARKYVIAAGILPWSEFWNSLRASRETDLMDSHGPNDACKWIGNTLAVAARHYQLMKRESYAGRAQKSAAKSAAVPSRNQENRAASSNKKTNKSLVSSGYSTPNRN